MANRISPSFHIVAETKIEFENIDEALGSLGVPDWGTDAFSESEYLTEFAGKLCYKSFSTALNPNLLVTGSRNNYDYIQKGIIGQDHTSVLRHSSVSVLFVNVSRVFTHELVRHAAGTAVSQESGRYCRVKELCYFIPECIKADMELLSRFICAMDDAEKNYQKLLKFMDIDNQTFEKKKELTSAARRILPEGRANHILFTGNHNSWRHILRLRTSEQAEEEIRIIMQRLLETFKTRYPALYADM